MNHTDKRIDLLSGRKNDGKPLAQFAEMESAEKPLTWNERINQMTVEEKDVLLERWRSDTRKMAETIIPSFWSNFYGCYVFEDDGFSTRDEDEAIDHYVAILNSPAEVEA